jgi:hypothetical protein
VLQSPPASPPPWRPRSAASWPRLVRVRVRVRVGVRARVRVRVRARARVRRVGRAAQVAEQHLVVGILGGVPK